MNWKWLGRPKGLPVSGIWAPPYYFNHFRTPRLESRSVIHRGSYSARPNVANPEVQQEDGLGKPKFSLPKFEGSNDVEEYLIWELKIEKLWRLHEYTEDRKIKLTSSEFDGYALRWWDNLVRTRQEEGDPPIITWRTMKQVMRDRFIPRNYIRSLYDKLQTLKQGTKSVDDYYQEMELIMQR